MYLFRGCKQYRGTRWVDWGFNEHNKINQFIYFLFIFTFIVSLNIFPLVTDSLSIHCPNITSLPWRGHWLHGSPGCNTGHDDPCCCGCLYLAAISQLYLNCGSQLVRPRNLRMLSASSSWRSVTFMARSASIRPVTGPSLNPVPGNICQERSDHLLSDVVCQSVSLS